MVVSGNAWVVPILSIQYGNTCVDSALGYLRVPLDSGDHDADVHDRDDKERQSPNGSVTVGGALVFL